MEKPMKKPKLPNTDSIQKLAQFWDTHDLTDFEEELEEVADGVCPRTRHDHDRRAFGSAASQSHREDGARPRRFAATARPRLGAAKDQSA